MNEKSIEKIVVIDDEKHTHTFFQELLGSYYTIISAYDSHQASEILKTEHIALAILDIKLPEINGIEYLKWIRTNYPEILVIMITGYGTPEVAIESIKAGAHDFLTKPFEDIERVRLIVDNAFKQVQMHKELKRLKGSLMPLFIGESEPVKKILKLIEKIAGTDSTILLTGESGTGKELIARLIYEMSNRKNNAFHAINCSALPETLLESELFGYEKGSFTGAYKTKKGLFELADKGTLFLDEIANTSLNFQAKLLRVIQERVFIRVGGDKEINTDIRLITATNKDLQQCIKQGTFRDDLYFRLNVMEIKLPALRERKQDLVLLTKFFIDKYSVKLNKKIEHIEEKVIDMFKKYDWPGNVRELENVIERMCILSEGPILNEQLLPESFIMGIQTSQSPIDLALGPGSAQIEDFNTAKKNFEKNYLIQILKKTKGNISKASLFSAIQRQNLYEKLKKYGLNIKDYR
ncbi:MAG: sigma-54 dependent transcriptional regulator [Candidatus Hydrogenedentota bacterium]